jgi:hypothetical protein
MDTVNDSARLFEESDFVVVKTVENVRLDEGDGLDWREIRIEQLTASGVTEDTVNENFQELENTLFSVTPGMTQCTVRITDKTYRRISKTVGPLLGKGIQLAMNRKMETDGTSQFSNWSNGVAGTGTSLAQSDIGAAVNNIFGNTTETGINQGPIHAVLHSFQIADLEDELLQGISTYNVPKGLTEDIYRQNWAGMCRGANVWRADNITIDATPDARGSVHAERALVLVRELGLRTETERFPRVGGGADAITATQGYEFGERQDAWGFSVLSNATAPTG